jgi:catechol 2,3-dioxygenase-like lactoylglutathione lyase family enzyme
MRETMIASKSRIHINLSVRDIEASKAFYAELFGAGPTKTREGYANWRLDAPALHLAASMATVRSPSAA